MSIDAELATSLANLNTNVQALGKSVETMDQRLGTALEKSTRGAHKLGEAIHSSGGAVEKMGEKWMHHLEMLPLKFVGVTELWNLAMDRVREYQKQVEEATRATGNFVSQTRGLGSDSPGMRRAIRSAAPELTPDEQVAAMKAWTSGGGARTPDAMAQLGPVLSKAQVLGWDTTDTARRMAQIRKAKVDNPEDLLAYLMQRGEMEKLDSMKPGAIRAKARHARGAFQAAIDDQHLSPEDAADLSAKRLDAAAKNAEANHPQALDKDVDAARDRAKRAGVPEDTLDRLDVRSARTRSQIADAKASATNRDALRAEARKDLERHALFKWLVTDSAVEHLAEQMAQERAKLPDQAVKPGSVDDLLRRSKNQPPTRVEVINQPNTLAPAGATH